MEEQEHDDKANAPTSGTPSADADAGTHDAAKYDAPVESKRGADGRLDIVPDRDAIMGRDRADIGRATDDDVDNATYGDEGGGQLYGEDDGDDT